MMSINLILFGSFPAHFEANTLASQSTLKTSFCMLFILSLCKLSAIISLKEWQTRQKLD